MILLSLIFVIGESCVRCSSGIAPIGNPIVQAERSPGCRETSDLTHNTFF